MEESGGPFTGARHVVDIRGFVLSPMEVLVSRRRAILWALAVGLGVGVGAGLLLTALYSRGLPAAYAFSALVYGVGAGGGAALVAALLSAVVPARAAARIAGGGAAALASFLVIGYWGNKWLLAGVPFDRPVSLLFDAGALIVSAALGFVAGLPVGSEGGRRRLVASCVVMIALPLAALPLTLPRSAPPAKATDDRRLSVLLVSFDAQRADHLGCYGYDRATSPVVDRLAAEGVSFDRAFCPVPSTSPSHASMLTGVRPQTHGVRANAYVLDPRAETIAETFSKAGYATGGFTTNVLLGSRFGFSQGFDSYVESGHVEKIGSWNLGLLVQSLTVKEMIDKFLYRYRGGGDPTVRAAKAWLAKIGDRPFFVFFHLLDPHTPYDPREPFRSRFPEEARRSENQLWFDTGNDPARLARALSLYDGEVASADAKLGELLRFLAAAGRDRNLLVVFTADHGENLGDHRPFFGHRDVYDSVLHVPLVFHLPGELPEGERVEALVDNRDIVPTILALAGIPAPPEVEGRDLGPALRGTDGPGEPYFLAYHGKRYALRTRDRKLMLDFKSGERRLYHLDSDPRETRSLAGDEAEEADTLEQILRSEVKRVERGDYLREEEGARMETLDRETKERLRALGYLD